MGNIREHRMLLSEAYKLGRPEALKKKTFIPTSPLPRLNSYEGALADDYWNLWTKLTWEEVDHKSWVDPDSLWEVCSEAGVQNIPLLRKVCDYVRNGARIGCRGEGRLPTYGINDKSINLSGFQVMDAVHSWVSDGICLGPLKESELPFDNYTISPLTTRPKPNGSLRIILDLSSPHLDDYKLGDGVPLSVNAGIKKEEYVTTMTSTTLWLQALMNAGVGCVMSKCDWTMAYKHFHVHKEDLPLQVFKVANRFFVELRLIFGAVSSPALFDHPNWLVTEAAWRLSGFPRECLVKQLDDLCACSRNIALMKNFVATYRDLCSKVGIRLAPDDEADREKAFTAVVEGTVLGVIYRTKEWSWNIPMEKLKGILHDLYSLLDSNEVSNGFAMKISGKIVHYAPLVANSKWWKRPFLVLQVTKARKCLPRSVSKNTKTAALWWISVFNSLRLSFLPLPDVRGGFPMFCFDIYPDASGVHIPGNPLRRGGGVFLETGHYTRMIWPSKETWRSLHGCKMTFLEAVAALQGLLTALKINGRGNYRLHVDNASVVKVCICHQCKELMLCYRYSRKATALAVCHGQF